MFVENIGNNLFRVRENEKGMWVKDEMALTTSDNENEVSE
jgi:hypothetical protein